MWVRVTGLKPEDLGKIHMRLKLGVPLYTITTLLPSWIKTCVNNKSVYLGDACCGWISSGMVAVDIVDSHLEVLVVLGDYEQTHILPVVPWYHLGMVGNEHVQCVVV